MAGINQTPVSIPEMQNFEDVRLAMSKAIRDLQSSIASQLPIVNYQGKRISNVGAPVGADDVVTLKYLQSGAPAVVTPPSAVNVATLGKSGTVVHNPFGYTPPAGTDYSWVNQETATYTNAYGPLDMTNVPAGGKSNHLWSLVKAVPVAPYRFAVNIQLNGPDTVRGGLTLRDSVSGKQVNWYLNWNASGIQMLGDNWSSPTANNANYFGTTFLSGFTSTVGIWLAFYDDNTLRHFQYGIGDATKVYWNDRGTTLRTDYITPDQIGFVFMSTTTDGATPVTLRVNHASLSL